MSAQRRQSGNVHAVQRGVRLDHPPVLSCASTDSDAEHRVWPRCGQPLRLSPGWKLAHLCCIFLDVSLAACANYSPCRGDRCRRGFGVVPGGQLHRFLRSVVCRRGARQHLQRLAAHKPYGQEEAPATATRRATLLPRSRSTTPPNRSSPSRPSPPGPSTPSCALAGIWLHWHPVTFQIAATPSCARAGIWRHSRTTKGQIVRSVAFRKYKRSNEEHWHKWGVSCTQGTKRDSGLHFSPFPHFGWIDTPTTPPYNRMNLELEQDLDKTPPPKGCRPSRASDQTST